MCGECLFTAVGVAVGRTGAVGLGARYVSIWFTSICLDRFLRYLNHFHSCLIHVRRRRVYTVADFRSCLDGCRCPVCRANLPGWDGRGGGVIGLKARVLISL